MSPSSSSSSLLVASCLVVAALCMASSVQSFSFLNQQDSYPILRSSAALAARRSADDARLLSRRQDSSSAPEAVVMGKFKAPAPSAVQTRRIPKSTSFGAQTLSASFRVADSSSDPADEKVVHGIMGDSMQNKPRQAESVLRRVSAKMLVSDEGLNYPPSKLSADINGNVAEIVTAPPEAVEDDFLAPQVSKLFGNRRNF